MTRKYEASMDTGQVTMHATIREARAWAEEYGKTAYRCTIRNGDGVVVAEHLRDPNGDGTRWFRAYVGR